MQRLIASLLFLVSLTNVIVAQDAKDHEIELSKDAIKQKIVQEIQLELKSLFQHEFDMAIRSYQQRFKLKKQTIENLRKLAVEFSQKKLEGVGRKQIETILIQHNIEFEKIESFSINETLFKLAPNSQKKPVEIKVSRLGSQLWISSARAGSSIGCSVQIDLRKNKQWRRVLANISDLEFQQYYKNLDQEKLKLIIDLMLAVLADELLLTDNQIKPTESWLRENVKKPMPNSISVYADAKYYLTTLDSSKLPKALSAAQQNALKDLQIRLKNL